MVIAVFAKTIGRMTKAKKDFGGHQTKENKC